jgi:uncharacterized protein (TIGR02996 family)
VTEEDALMRAVIAEPDDDAPRLIYADWLDEHGESERAEFIRVQIAAAGLSLKDPRLPPLWRREGQLLRRNREAWAAPIRAVSRAHRFFRGFVEYVACDAGQVLSYGGELFTLAPIRDLTILNAHSFAARLSQCPHLSRPIALDLARTWLDSRDVRHLANSTVLRPLTSLNLSHNRIGAAGATYLARSPYLGSLDDLYLTGNPIPREARGELQRRYGGRVHF